ncbi:MAG: PEP/pyruvate-binding domain-containing protein, partial [Pseudomonadota bacterium]
MVTELLSPNLDATQVGAKAAGVGRAIELGLAVPAGFVVTRAALQHFLEATGLETRVHAFLSSRDDRVTRTECFAQLEADVLASDPPDNLVAALSVPATALLEQSPCGLAVRSSGVLEDSATASFAGVYDSFLGVTSLPDFWDAVR